MATATKRRLAEKPRMRWPYAPLLAFVVLSLWPIAYMPFLSDSELTTGYTRLQQTTLFVFVLALANWPLLVLAYVSAQKAEKELSRRKKLKKNGHLPGLFKKQCRSRLALCSCPTSQSCWVCSTWCRNRNEKLLSL
jgi:hypothetical protein